MKKKVMIFLKLLLLLCPPFLFIAVSLSSFPMKFMDSNYVWYRQNKDFSFDKKTPVRVLVIGDSTAKAAWLPAILSSDTYNFASSGATPIEEYYYLREYLQNHEAPEVIVYTQHLIHFYELDTFWNRSVYFHRISKHDLYDLRKDLCSYKDISIFGDVNFDKEVFLYSTYSPMKYSQAFLNGLFSSKRYRQNMETYVSVEKSRGQTQFTTAEYCDEVNKYARLKSFEVNEIINSYFIKIISLCEENNIQFIYQSPPLNQSSYDVLNNSFVNEYMKYMESLQSDYPNTLIDTKFFCYGNGYFGDSAHLNKRGTLKFSHEMREKYKDIFEPEE